MQSIPFLISVFPDLERGVTFVTRVLEMQSQIWSRSSSIAISDMPNRQSSNHRRATRRTHCCPTGHAYNTNTRGRTSPANRNPRAHGCESRTKQGKQHSISHIVQNCVVFTGRMVKTV